MWHPFKKNNVIKYTHTMKKADGFFGVLLNSISTIRRTLGGGQYGFSPDGKRNYNELFGYGESLSFDDYMGMYRRGGIAKTVVDKIPKACWREKPELKIGETSILENELLILKNKGLFDGLERADILNRIGNFSVLLIGVPDGLDLDQPLGLAGANAFEKVYFNPYAYDGIEITKIDDEATSDRFGLPVMYQLQTTLNSNSSTKDRSVKAHNVHFSRIVHMAEGALQSSIEGSSILEALWNALIDKDKVRGGSAEAFFRNSRQKLALETDKDATVSTDEADISALKENVENFQNGWEDVLRLNNMKANMLQPSLVSPRDSYDTAIEEIAGTSGIAIRLLTTKSGGVVTGSEDKASFNSLISDRSIARCTPWLLRSLSIFADAGMLVLPQDVEVIWPVQPSLTDTDQSEVFNKKASAFKSVIDALSTAGADEVDAESVFEVVGLSGIEIDIKPLDDPKVDKE